MNNQTENKSEDLQDILNSIKDVISSSQDDVLELTEVVDIPQSEKVNAAKSTENSKLDILLEVPTASTSTDHIALDLNSLLATPPSDADIEHVHTGLLDEKIAAETKKVLANAMPKSPKKNGPEFRSGVILEELVLEILKPMLKSWLDDNLLNIVKTTVEKEVRKILPKED